MLPRAGFLIWERVLTTLTSVQNLPQLLFSCKHLAVFLTSSARFLINSVVRARYQVLRRIRVLLCREVSLPTRLAYEYSSSIGPTSTTGFDRVSRLI